MINFKIFLIFKLFFYIGMSLTGDEIAAYCYCDITQNFCDFDCCCDASCSSQTDNTCLNVNAQFCIERDYYYKVSTEISQNTVNQDCYDYAEESSIQEQVSPSSRQIISYVKKASKLVPVSNTLTGMYQGYKSNVAFGVESISNFEFVQSDGTCLSSSSSMTNLHFSLKFKNNVRVTCSATSNSVKIFSSFLGKRVYQYYQNTNSSSTITIPSEMDSTHNELHIYFILGTYGSQKLFYIRNVETRTVKNSNSNLRTLVIKYINPYTDYKQEQAAPSFFPQIPYDIFYPIQQFVYSF